MSAASFIPASAYRTAFGAAHVGCSLELMAKLPEGGVNLIVTSPPFALERKKAYGNESKADYVAWLVEFGRAAHRVLSEDGSLVVDLGGSYEPGVPIRSLYPFRALIALCDEAGFSLGQDFYWHNPAALPAPIQWVNLAKQRVKSSTDTVWWLVKSPKAKADVRRVLVPYGERMRALIAKGHVAARRPSGHQISSRIAEDKGGAIPANMLSIPNTDSNGAYLRACRAAGVKPHPARFPAGLPRFFVRFLTEPGDLVLDIFAGSNTTGAVAESEGRRWLAFERDPDYVAASAFRFAPAHLSGGELAALRARVLEGGSVDLRTVAGPDAAESAAASAGSRPERRNPRKTAPVNQGFDAKTLTLPDPS